VFNKSLFLCVNIYINTRGPSAEVSLLCCHIYLYICCFEQISRKMHHKRLLIF
jgi:hypothetical protein